MKFWKLSSYVLAALVSAAAASGPSDGDAIADPNSAVVKLTAADYQSFIDSNPLVLAEFFAPWCGYCKQLAPEFTKAANSLNETNPNIKLAQVDCTVEEELCMQHEIRGYPTLKVIRGSENKPDDYDGPREASGIVDYMVAQSKPAVQTIESADAAVAAIADLKKPAVIQILPADYKEGKQKENSTYFDVALARRKELTFLTIQDSDAVKALQDKFKSLKASKSPVYIAIQPGADDVVPLAEKFSKDALEKFITTEKVPYFGEINRETYLAYMTSPIPLAYYFYNSPDQKEALEKTFNDLGKKYRGKLNFVGLDATLFGRHAEILSMDPETIPLFAIQDVEANKKYGLDQKKNPNPSAKAITKFVEDFVAGKLSPIIKSQPLPTEEEVAAQPVVKLVAYNYESIVKDTSKDVFVKYYAEWCGHCKQLAPTWDELASIYDSNKPDANVVIAKLEHPENDVDVPVPIEGYPTILLYPANGEIDEKTGLRVPVTFNGARNLEALIDFVKENGGHKVDGHALKEAKGGVVEDEDDEVVEEKKEEQEEKDVDHDEL